ncbi:carbohydrate esterase family 4 protein [Alternaria alternata]|nr:carbohydrate esterase family 4 protein [Alternaria alternata]
MAQPAMPIGFQLEEALVTLLVLSLATNPMVERVSTTALSRTRLLSRTMMVLMSTLKVYWISSRLLMQRRLSSSLESILARARLTMRACHGLLPSSV